MSWPILTPVQIASNAAGIYESTFPGIDARSANSVAATNTRIVGMTGYDLYLYQGYQAQQMFANTATDDLYLHANIWGVPQLQATAGTGSAVANGANLTSIPAGALATAPGGALYMVRNAVTIGTSLAVAVPMISVLAGSAYNLAGGTVLRLVSPIAGLSSQNLTLDTNGVANGTDIETTASWQSRILQKIRTPPQGGAVADYQFWAKAAGAAYVNVVGGFVGAGSVGVIIAGPGPSVASPQLVAAVQTYIDGQIPVQGVRPVTARVIVSAATLVPVDVSFTLNPDSIATRAAGANALALFFQQSAQIGGTLYMSRLDNALASASGEYSHERQAPTADVVFTNTQLGVLGTINWVAGP